jgi:hypothetical protein
MGGGRDQRLEPGRHQLPKRTRVLPAEEAAHLSRRSVAVGGPPSQLEPGSEPIIRAILAIPQQAVRENGPSAEPGMVTEDSPGPGARSDHSIPTEGPPTAS